MNEWALGRAAGPGLGRDGGKRNATHEAAHAKRMQSEHSGRRQGRLRALLPLCLFSMCFAERFSRISAIRFIAWTRPQMGCTELLQC